MSTTKNFAGHSHGTRSRYHAGCRCGPCTVANSDYIAGRASADTARIVPAAPWRTIIRSVALQMDAEPERLVKACGLNGATAAGILSGRYRTITTYTADRLRKLLDLLPSEALS